MVTIKTRVRKIFAPYLTVSSGTIDWRDLTAGTSGTSGYPIVGVGNGEGYHRFNIDLTQFGYNEGDIVDLLLDIDPINIITMQFSMCNFIEVDLSDADNFSTWKSYPHPELKKLTLPTNPTVSLNLATLISTGLEGTLDFSNYSSTASALDIQTYFSTNLTQILMPTSTNVDVLNLYQCNLTGIFDMTNMKYFTSLNVSNNPNLVKINFNPNSTETGSITISNTGISGVLDLSMFETLTHLTAINVPNLNNVMFSTSGSAEMQNLLLNNNNLKGTLDLSSFSAIKNVTVKNCPNLDELILPSSSTTNTVTFDVDYNGASGILDATGLTITTLLSIETTNFENVIFSSTPNTNNITTFDIRIAPFIGTLDVSMFVFAKEFIIEYLPGITELIMPASHTNTALTSIVVRNLSITSLDLSGFTSLGTSIQMYGNRNLTTIAFPSSMPRMFTSIYLQGNKITGDFDLRNTEGLTGIMQIEAEHELLNIYGPINKPMTNMIIQYNTNLQTIDCGSITSFKNVLRVNRNASLTTLLLPAVVSETITELQLTSNFSLINDFDFTNYTDIKTEFNINYCPISSLKLPQSGASLTNTYTTFVITLTLVTSVDLSLYTGTISYLTINYNQNCTSIICPASITTGTLNFSNNPITSLDITTFNGNILDIASRFYISKTLLDKTAVQQLMDDVDSKTRSGLSDRRVYIQNMQNLSAQDITDIQNSASYASLVSKLFTIYF